MFRRGNRLDPDLDPLLRQGMRQLPVPEATPGFDARVHQALAEPEAWWLEYWRLTRPILTMAAASMAVSICLLAGMHMTPPGPGSFHRNSAIALGRPLDLDAIDTTGLVSSGSVMGDHTALSIGSDSERTGMSFDGGD